MALYFWRWTVGVIELQKQNGWKGVTNEFWNRVFELSSGEKNDFDNQAEGCPSVMENSRSITGDGTSIMDDCSSVTRFLIIMHDRSAGYRSFSSSKVCIIHTELRTPGREKPIPECPSGQFESR